MSEAYYSSTVHSEDLPSQYELQGSYLDEDLRISYEQPVRVYSICEENRTSDLQGRR